MEKQAKQNLLSFIKGIESVVCSEEKVVQNLIKKDSYYSVYDIVTNIREYAESLKNLLFRRLCSLVNQNKINIYEFNEINDCLNIQFNLVEEFIEDNLPELYDKNATSFMEIYFNIESGLEAIYYTIREL